MPRARLDIGIVGAGPAGLAAAIALARAGHAPVIFERFARPQPIGAGLLLQPTGLACLARFGLDQAAIASGARIDCIAGLTARGRLIFDVGYGRLAPHLHGLGIHRASLFALLHDEARRLGIPITPATEITHSQLVGEGRSLHAGGDGVHATRDGMLGQFDLVVDAGGTRSVLRQQLASIRLARPYPFGAVWGVAPLPQDWRDANTLGQRYDGCEVMLGVLPIGYSPQMQQGEPKADRSAATLAAERAAERAVADRVPMAAMFWSLRRDAYERWRAEGMEVWKARLLDYWPEIAPMLDAFVEADDLTMASYSDVILASPVAERLVFIGDAAHSTSPQLGQGANLSLIDAVILADCLSAARPDGQAIAAALADYASRRRKHVRFYQYASRWLTPFFQSHSRLAALLRDASFAPMGKTPIIRSEMVRVLAGMKTGLIGHMDPGKLHSRYGLRAHKQGDRPGQN